MLAHVCTCLIASHGELLFLGVSYIFGSFSGGILLLCETVRLE